MGIACAARSTREVFFQHSKSISNDMLFPHSQSLLHRRSIHQHQSSSAIVPVSIARRNVVGACVNTRTQCRNWSPHHCRRRRRHTAAPSRKRFATLAPLSELAARRRVMRIYQTLRISNSTQRRRRRRSSVVRLSRQQTRIELTASSSC